MLSISSSNDSNGRHQTLPHCSNSNDSSKSVTNDLENSHKRPAVQISCTAIDHLSVALNTTSTTSNVLLHCQTEQNASKITTKRPRYIEVSSQSLQVIENNEVEHKQFMDVIQKDNNINSYIVCNDNDNNNEDKYDFVHKHDVNEIVEATSDNLNEDKSFENNIDLYRHDDHRIDRHSSLWIFQRQCPKQSSILTQKIDTTETNLMKVTNNISTEKYNDDALTFNKHEYESDQVDLLDQQMDCLIRQTENWSLFHARRNNKNNSSHLSYESSHQKSTDDDGDNNNNIIGIKKTNISTFDASNDDDTIILKHNQDKARTARRNVMRAFLKKGEPFLQNKS